MEEANTVGKPSKGSELLLLASIRSSSPSPHPAGSSHPSRLRRKFYPKVALVCSNPPSTILSPSSGRTRSELEKKLHATRRFISGTQLRLRATTCFRPTTTIIIEENSRFLKARFKSAKSDLVGGYSSISEYDTSFRLPPSSPYDKFLKAAGC
ncbi:hypothetical protein MRB53_028360 [Persea americana]|uniref:Uncharacterized protein n=1 Tax=Persea americana TaxID=3435 RepID=A0ACC2KFG7_PERAE|nr:hypothetical protein MRB53_028360 [Persea americana]